MAVELARASYPFLVTLPGVYPPQGDTWLLMTAVEREGIRPGAHVLEARQRRGHASLLPGMSSQPVGGCRGGSRATQL
ncbi:hypothetical protein [Streptomyces sp. NPDC102437]|uniref:hypothetical protein n=1 Tax=Streptomyces sp. NPDC102437 TaxID=3366175 RepID=UPI00380083A3